MSNDTKESKTALLLLNDSVSAIHVNCYHNTLLFEEKPITYVVYWKCSQFYVGFENSIVVKWADTYSQALESIEINESAREFVSERISNVINYVDIKRFYFTSRCTYCFRLRYRKPEITQYNNKYGSFIPLR